MLGIHLSSFTRVPNCKFTNKLLPALLHGQEVNKPARYLIKTTRICVRSGDLHIAEFCLHYLNFGCFDAHLTDAEIRNFLRQRYYSFEDYAIAHWLDHVESSTAQLLPLETISLERLAQRLEVFLGKHWSDSPLIPLVTTEPRFQSIRQWDFTDKLDTLAQLAHQRKSNGNFLDIEVQVQRRRLIYEDIIINNNPYNEAFREHLLLNTSGCFKCPKKYCDYFFDGFANKEYRDKHINQHERPFRCSFKECPYAELGYGTEKELKQHQRKSHPSGQGSEWAFPTYKPKRVLNIFSACEKGDLATVQRLVREGADVNQKLRPNGHRTPLFFTFKNDHADVAKYLIEQGAKNDWVMNASWVTRSASISVLRVLLEMEADPTRRIECAHDALISARTFNWVDAIPLLLSYGVDINRKDLSGMTPLQWAEHNGQHAFVQALLEHRTLDDTPTPTPVTPVTPRPGSSSSPSVHNRSD